MTAVKDVVRLWDEILHNADVRSVTKEQILNTCDQEYIKFDIDCFAVN
jgi:hypothetical protein